MADKDAVKMYELVKQTLDESNFEYKSDDENLTVNFIVSGDDIPMQFIFEVDDTRKILKLLSPIGCTFPEERRLLGADATNYINDMLADGSFDYDYTSGKTLYRITSSYRESLISKRLIVYMIGFSAHLVDDYNDKLMMLSKGVISFEDFKK